MRVLVRPARLATVAAAAVVAVSGALPAAPATASPPSTPPTAPTPSTEAAAALSTAMLRLTVYEGEDDTGNELREAVLVCDPDSGSHPNAKAACDALRAVGGDLTRITARDGICIKVHQPVTAVVEGWYRGARNFKKTYGNDCALKNALGPVFDF